MTFLFLATAKWPRIWFSAAFPRWWFNCKVPKCNTWTKPHSRRVTCTHIITLEKHTVVRKWVKVGDKTSRKERDCGCDERREFVAGEQIPSMKGEHQKYIIYLIDLWEHDEKMSLAFYSNLCTNVTGIPWYSFWSGHFISADRGIVSLDMTEYIYYHQLIIEWIKSWNHLCWIIVIKSYIIR